MGYVPRRIRPPSGGGGASRASAARPEEELPDSLHKHLDRSAIPGAPVKLPPGLGLAYDTTKHRMDRAIGAMDAAGNQSAVTLDDAPGDTEQNRQTKAVVRAARDEMLRREPDNFRPGEFLGAGAAGAVFRGPKSSDQTDTVYKFDAGPYEARMADAVMKAGLVGPNGLAILPRYISTHQTGVKFSEAGLPVHVIHREDLADVKTGLDRRDRDILGGLGPRHKPDEIRLLSRTNPDALLPHTVRDLMGTISALANPKDAPDGVDPNDVGAERTRYRETPHGGIAARTKRHGGGPVPWSDKKGIGLTRREMLQMFDAGIKTIRRRALRGNGALSRQWGRIESDLRKMLQHGIAPCDLHTDNWGIRSGTGEITMRDAGCASVVEH